MRHRRASAIAVTSMVACLLAGCSTSQRPSYDLVRDEARAAMQRIVDELPPSTQVDEGSDSAPFGRDGGGVFSTGHWAAYPGDGFDGDAFVGQLPTALGSDFTVQDLGVDVSFPSVDLVATAYGGAGMSVFVLEDGGTTVVDILATSRCAEPPTPSMLGEDATR